MSKNNLDIFINIFVGLTIALLIFSVGYTLGHRFLFKKTQVRTNKDNYNAGINNYSLPRVEENNNIDDNENKNINNQYNSYQDDNNGPSHRTMYPIPRNAFKETSERYKTPFYNSKRPLLGTDFYRPYESLRGTQIRDNIVASDIPFYNRAIGPYGIGLHEINEINGINGFSHAVGSANAFAPFPEVTTPWEKVGILTLINERKGDTDHKEHKENILNLYRRPIAPLQDLFEYSVQDRDGFIILLKHKNLLEDKDIIRYIPGKPGEWIFHDFVQNKYVWV